MNSTSQTPRDRFPFSSGPDAMDNWGLFVTLAKAVGVAFVVILLVSAAQGASLLPRVGYGILVCVPPAFGVVAVIKITRILLSRLGAVVIYAVLLVLVVIFQAVGRLIPVYS